MYQPSCSTKIVDSLECAQMARSLMRDLSTFYEPILNQKEQKRWVQLYVKKIFKERLPDNIEKDPAADMMIWFDLTPQALEVRVRDILKGEDVAEVEQPVRSSKPAHLRRVVADAAKKTTRRIMSSYDPAFGDTYYLRVKVKQPSERSAGKPYRWPETACTPIFLVG